MSFFKRGEIETLDLTKDRNKRLLAESRKIFLKNNSESRRSQNNDFVDLGSLPIQRSSPVSSATSPPPGFDFLSSLANSSSGNNSNSFSGGSENLHEKNIQHLKVKIKDIEYKLERFLERLEKIENNLDKK